MTVDDLKKGIEVKEEEDRSGADAPGLFFTENPHV